MNLTENRICKNCKKFLPKNPSMIYHDMPGRAQYFPDVDHLCDDKSVDLYLFQCRHCGLIQLANDPVYYYRDVIRAASVSDEMHEFRVGFYSDFLDKYGLRGKKIIEIGAGNGEFMQFMSEAGGNVYGVENNEYSVTACVEQGLDVEKWFPDKGSSRINCGPFDGFYIMNFLEHIPEPDIFLETIADNLNTDAIGLIEVPNTDMILKHGMFSEFMLDHLMYFTKDSLTGLLCNNGFDVLECNSVWHDYCLSAVVRKRNLNTMSEFSNIQKKIINEINEYIDSFKDKDCKVAVWGAGHQSLAVISMSNISDKIEFVIDSADFKQNRYTPGSHCIVVSPKALNNTNIDAILVMAASYSDEVSRIIKAEYPEINIAILREYGLEFVDQRY